MPYTRAFFLETMKMPRSLSLVLDYQLSVFVVCVDIYVCVSVRGGRALTGYVLATLPEYHLPISFPSFGREYSEKLTENCLC